MTSKPFIVTCILLSVCLTAPTVAQPVDCNANGIPDICDVGPCTCGAGDNLPDVTLTIEILTDFFPAETTWELTDQTIGVVASGGPLDLPNTLITQDVPVCSASCYDFTIFDVFGDGICCGGFYNLLLDGVIIATGTSFGFEETVSNIGDCVVGASADCNANGIPDECESQADCNGNGIQDFCDIANGTSQDCNTNGFPDACDIANGTSLDSLPVGGDGIPDECQSDCNGNLILDADDIANGTSADCNINGIPDECDLAGGISEDCQSNGIPDECESQADCNGNGIQDFCDIINGISPDDLPVGGDGIPDECQLDCNGNLIPDTDDITQGTSQDCNSNAIPDECDISSGTSQDCNANGFPDECDIAGGAAQDCDANGIPDECESQEDCNGNGIQDICDIAIGTSNDCNANGIPDECDISVGTHQDCNANGIPDDCDSAQLTQQAKLTAPDAASGDFFGVSVSISGNTVIIGSKLDDCTGDNSGSVYVFVRTGLVQTLQAKLTAADAESSDQFGASVSISGDTAIIGSPGDDDGGSVSGSAYVFIRTGTVWTQQAKLTADDATIFHQFGESVSISGDTAVIGAIGDDHAGNISGSAYVFVRTAGVWMQQAKLTAADAAAEDFFGSSVSISGDTVVIGSILDDDAGNNSGSAYVFVRSGSLWTQQAKIIAADAAAGDWFGRSVWISADTSIIGSPFDDDAGDNSGSAYVFVRSGTVWVQQTKLTAADAAADDWFGRSVSINGDSVVIGALQDDDAGSNTGSAYVFIRTAGVWTQLNKLTATDAAPVDLFGFSVSISGDTAVIGAHRDDDLGLDSGSAYVFSTFGSDCQADGIPDDCQLAGNDCNADDIPDDCQLADNDCNADDIPDDCQLADNDCNADGVPDYCQLAGNDCNANMIPDECEPDCNTNGVSDECDIAGGTSLDCDIDGIPDECDVSPTQQTKLTTADAFFLDKFGHSASISGDTAIIGAYLDDDAGSQSGSAYVFVRSSGAWIQQAKLTAVDATSFDEFGFSVSISGDTVVIGSWLDNNAGSDSGSAYVFVRNGTIWTQQAKLSAADAESFDRFGVSVSISGDTAVIGSWLDDDAGALSGSAYVFVRTAGVWIQQAKLTADDAAADDRFGRCVSISGDTAVVGSFQDGDAGNSSGSAYVFVRTAGVWIQQAKLTADDAAVEDLFGFGISISGDTAVIGSFRDDDACPSDPDCDSGSAYIFVRSAGVWTQQAKLTAADAAAGNFFGSSVSISNDMTVIGASVDDDAGSASGSVYVFFRTAGVWTQHVKLTAVDAAAGDQFGWSVSISGNTAVIGSPFDDDAGGSSGSAYVFSPAGSDCQTNGIPDECDIADGTSNDCNANGIPDECDGFVDTTPPVINCEIVPSPEDDSEDNADAGDENAFDSPPNDQIDTIIQTGFGLISPRGSHREGIPIADEGYDGPIMILFDATDDCGPVTISAILDIGCEQIPVENGTLIDFECKEGDDSGDCEAEEEDGILEIEAATAVITVTATDETGNTSTCEIILCAPPEDSSDGDGSVKRNRSDPRLKSRNPLPTESDSAHRPGE